MNPAYHPDCFMCRKEAGRPLAGVAETHLCLSHLHAKIDALQAENKRLKKLIQDIIADGLDEYWMTIPEGKEVLERCRVALSPAEGKEDK